MFSYILEASSPGINCIQVTYDASLFAFDTGRKETFTHILHAYGP